MEASEQRIGAPGEKIIRNIQTESLWEQRKEDTEMYTKHIGYEEKV